jgi:hypothetical protein
LYQGIDAILIHAEGLAHRNNKRVAGYKGAGVFPSVFEYVIRAGGYGIFYSLAQALIE